MTKVTMVIGNNLIQYMNMTLIIQQQKKANKKVKAFA